MSEYITPILAALAVLIAVGWYCRRCGIADGRAEGYEAGRMKGQLEGAGAARPAGNPAPALSGGPREPA